jgi:hypothetical protein
MDVEKHEVDEVKPSKEAKSDKNKVRFFFFNGPEALKVMSQALKR